VTAADSNNKPQSTTINQNADYDSEEDSEEESEVVSSHDSEKVNAFKRKENPDGETEMQTKLMRKLLQDDNDSEECENSFGDLNSEGEIEDEEDDEEEEESIESPEKLREMLVEDDDEDEEDEEDQEDQDDQDDKRFVP
jgi:hypothetical protein